MKHAKPVSRAMIEPFVGLIDIIQLLITLGLMNGGGLLKKDDGPAPWSI